MSRRARNGFTLIEVMVALALVGAVATAVLAQMAAGSRASGEATETMTAVALADHRMETLRLLGREELLRLPDSVRAGRFEPPLDAYAWTSSAHALRDTPALIEVSVEIDWAGGSYPVVTRWYRP